MLLCLKPKFIMVGISLSCLLEQERQKQKQETYEKTLCFSILVPLYNTPEGFLRDMIESVQKQTYSQWELCLADGSDDEHSDVGKIVKEYADVDNRIKYKVLEENGGISENTNAAIYRFISSELPPISGVLRSISLYSLFTDLLYLFMSISGYICASLASACLKHSSSTAFAYIPYFNILIACPFYSCIHSLSAAESLLSISFLVASHSFG